MLASTCANPSCFNYPRRGSNLCGSCERLRDSVFIIGLCLGGSALMVVAVKVWGAL